MSVTSDRLTPIPRSWWTRIGFLLATFSLLALIAAFDERTLLQIDRPLQGWIVGARLGWVNDVMWGVTFLGTRSFIGAALLGFTIWSLATGRCRAALVVFILAFAFNPLIEWALKAGVDRVRPAIMPLGPGRGPSFPSGHVLASVGFYGILIGAVLVVVSVSTAAPSAPRSSVARPPGAFPIGPVRSGPLSDRWSG